MVFLIFLKLICFLDEQEFLPKGIKRIGISGSDTSDPEFDFNE